MQLKNLELKKMERFKYYRSSKTNGRIQNKLQTDQNILENELRI
jgi:hypothetical protein